MADVCLLAPTIAHGDAVGNDIAGMYAALRAHGVATHVFAERWTADVELPVRPIAEYDAHAGEPDGVTIYHHSIHSPAAAAAFLHARGTRVMRYHNVTPSRFFAPYSMELTQETALGHAQTQELAAGRVDLFLADSELNARELRDLGVPPQRCHTLPPFHQVRRLEATAAAMPVLERYLDAAHHLVFVGRVVPNKGHPHLLHVLACYRRMFRRAARLFVVGSIEQAVPGYHAELRALAQRLEVADAVVWTDHVSLAELKAYLLLAHAFLITSEHEGFCVPLLEAMALGVPIVAHGAEAVRDTVGDAGVVLDGMNHEEYAAALHLVITQERYRAPLVQRGRRRVAQQFDADEQGARFVALITPFRRRHRTEAAVER